MKYPPYSFIWPNSFNWHLRVSQNDNFQDSRKLKRRFMSMLLNSSHNLKEDLCSSYVVKVDFILNHLILFLWNPLCMTQPKKRPVLPSFSAYSFVAWLKLEFVEETGTKQLAEHVQAIAIKIFVKTLLFEFLAPLTSP